MPAFAFSRLEQGLRDMLISDCDDEALVHIAEMWGAPYPAGIDGDNFRAALRAVAMAPRGCPGPTFRFVAECLRQFATDVEVTLDPAYPQRITRSSGTFGQADVARYVEIHGAIYWSVGPADVDAAGGSYLDLCKTATAQWARADWAPLAAAETATATLYPFWYWERSPGPTSFPAGVATGGGSPCLLEVLMRSNANLGPPPSYILADASARPSGMPYGGQILESQWVDGSQSHGPYPLYLPGDTTLGVLRSILKPLLAAGVHVRFSTAQDK